MIAKLFLQICLHSYGTWYLKSFHICASVAVPGRMLDNRKRTDLGRRLTTNLEWLIDWLICALAFTVQDINILIFFTLKKKVNVMGYNFRNGVINIFAMTPVDGHI